MATVRVAAGTATGPTELAAYDAALAAANAHDYNLVDYSSVLPADTDVEVVESLPDLGPPGNRLYVVQAHATAAGPGTLAAGVGWATGPGPGLFYEASGESDSEVRRRIERGLAAARDLREWTFADEAMRVARTDAPAGEYASAVVLAAFGESEPAV